MKTLFTSLVLIFALGLGGASASASAIFGDSGNDRCGVGSMLWKGNSVSSQICEESTNALSMDAFSITTGTSGCSNSGIVNNVSEQQLHFASVNLEEIVSDMAKGQGEVLAGFSYSLGCSSYVRAHFGEVSQKSFQEIVPQQHVSPIDLIQRTKAKIGTDPVLSANCRGV
ncbi:MAG: DUF3015 family protein [Oligoflexia bacterium]|nr:DUF3015 family protein [Oligoflexia bacterium]